MSEAAGMFRLTMETPATERVSRVEPISTAEASMARKSTAVELVVGVAGGRDNGVCGVGCASCVHNSQRLRDFDIATGEEMVAVDLLDWAVCQDQ